MRLRKRTPQIVKHWFRLARHTKVQGRASPRLPPELVAECRLCASRDDMIKNMPHRARVAEVGVEHGHFSRHILSATDPTELHLIDLDFSTLDPKLQKDPRVSIHRGFSHEVLATFPDASFDWIYIDADHSYEGVRKDTVVAAKKVRPGGFLVFNDFAHADPYLGAYGVHRAVVEFAVERKWPLIWLAYEPNALYDVALKRPE